MIEVQAGMRLGAVIELNKRHASLLHALPGTRINHRRILIASFD
jgi:hypothetical protein